MTVRAISMVVLAYLLGSIPFGYIVSRVGYGVDIRERGSKNIGFTNVLRTLGPLPGSVTLVGDVLKGAAPVLFARWLGLSDAATIAVALAAIAGHNWTVFLRFKGGRGVATGFGAAVALTPPVTLACIALWGVILAVTRIVSLASVLAIAVYPVVIVFLYLRSDIALPYVALGLVGAPLIIWQHRANIKRLLNGEEPKIGAR